MNNKWIKRIIGIPMIIFYIMYSLIITFIGTTILMLGQVIAQNAMIALYDVAEVITGYINLWERKKV